MHEKHNMVLQEMFKNVVEILHTYTHTCTYRYNVAKANSNSNRQTIAISKKYFRQTTTNATVMASSSLWSSLLSVMAVAVAVAMGAQSLMKSNKINSRRDFAGGCYFQILEFRCLASKINFQPYVVLVHLLCTRPHKTQHDPTRLSSTLFDLILKLALVVGNFRNNFQTNKFFLLFLNAYGDGIIYEETAHCTCIWAERNLCFRRLPCHHWKCQKSFNGFFFRCFL